MPAAPLIPSPLRRPCSAPAAAPGAVRFAVLAAALLALPILFSSCDRFWWNQAERAPVYSDTLRVALFSGYLDSTVTRDFMREHGVYVLEHYHTTNEQILEHMASDDPVDLAMLSGYAIPELIRRRQLFTIRVDSIPNRRNIDRQFTSLDYDFGSIYSVPMFWGTLGLTYHADRVSGLPLTWERFYNPADHIHGYVSALPDMRFSLGTALIYLGYSPNTTRQSQIDSAAALIEGQKPYLRAFQTANVEDSLHAGKLLMAQLWSSSAAYAHSLDADLRFVLPGEGALYYVDNFVIPRRSAHRSLAETYINYLLEPHNMAAHTNYSYSANTVGISRRYIDPTIAQGPAYINPFITPNAYQLNTLPEDTVELYRQAWDRLDVGRFEGHRPPAITIYRDQSPER